MTFGTTDMMPLHRSSTRRRRAGRTLLGCAAAALSLLASLASAQEMAPFYGAVGHPSHSPYAGYPPHGAPPPPVGYYHGPPPALAQQTYAELLPSDRFQFVDPDSSFMLDMKQTIANSYFRLDYTFFQIEAPGNTLLSAPVSTAADFSGDTQNPTGIIPDPTQPFPIVLPDLDLGVVKMMDTSGVKFNNLNGIRGTLGIPAPGGFIESSFWGLERASHMIDASDFLARDAEPPLTEPAPNGGRFFFPQPLRIGTGQNAIIDQIISRGQAEFIGQALLSDGAPGTFILLYDKGYTADYQVKTWTGEANYYYQLKIPDVGASISPLLGFRHMSYDEQLNQLGAFDNNELIDIQDTFLERPQLPDGRRGSPLGILEDPIVHQIYSETSNRMYGVQTGFRAELEGEWLTLGVEPKVAFGVNRIRNEVYTRNLRDNPVDLALVDVGGGNNTFTQLNYAVVDDPPDSDLDNDPATNVTGNLVRSRVSNTEFWPMLDLGLYAKIRVSSWANFRVGYNYLLTTNISRADRVIYYNDLGIGPIDNPIDPAVVARKKEANLWLQGLTIGGEIYLP